MAGGGPIDEIGYDPDFHPAVLRGTLSPYDARMRGNRRELVRKLVQVMALPPDLAEQVADNRLSIPEARRRKAARAAARPLPPPPEGLPRRSARTALVVSALTGLLALGGYAAVQLNEGGAGVLASRRPIIRTAPRAVAGPVTTPPALPEAVERTTNADGVVVRMEGPDPASILAAYCAAWPAEARARALRIDDGHDILGRRRGVFQAGSPGEEQLHAIWMSYNAVTSRWVLGTGRGPVRAEPLTR